MGQRLVVDITDGEKTLACAYYHWSAYTESAQAVAKATLESYYYDKDLKYNKYALAIKMLQRTGARLAPDEAKFISNMKGCESAIIYQDEVDRNDGIIYVTEPEILNCKDWSEGDIIINPLLERISFQVYYDMPKDDFIYEYKNDFEDVEEEFHKIPILEESLWDMSFEDFLNMPSLVEKYPGFARDLDDPEEYVACWIE